MSAHISCQRLIKFSIFNNFLFYRCYITHKEFSKYEENFRKQGSSLIIYQRQKLFTIEVIIRKIFDITINRLNSQSKNIQSSKSIEEIQQEENLIDKSLINYLNKNDSIEIQRNKKEKQAIIKPQIIQQPQPVIIQQPIQQIDLQQNSEDQSEIKNQMVKIRKFIQFFSKEESILHIIGSTEFQQRQFISRLYLKNLEELKLIHKAIEFELLFSRSNSFVQDSIESGALFIERLLLTIDINIVGVYQEIQQDEEFQFYMNMYLCESSYIASAEQILFLKFIKNYYKKYSENKNFKQKLKEQANKELLERFNKL